MRLKSNICSKCRAAPRASNARYCLSCKAAYMRSWRPTHPLTESQRAIHNARNYLKMYIKRGKVSPKPCELCGSQEVKGYQHDLSHPLEVTWLCQQHRDCIEA